MPVFEHPLEFFSRPVETSPAAAVCVIGSGPAGTFVAVELARTGVDVVLLEAGATEPDHRVDTFVDRVDVSGGVDLRFGFSRQLGGATNLWSGRLAPFERIDFENREWVPDSGWPVTADDMSPYYGRISNLLGIPGHSHFAGDHKAFLSSELIEIKTFQWASKPFNAGEYLKSAAARFDNLSLVLNAPVIRLIEEESTTRVVFADVALKDGGTAKMRALHYVIATGGIEAPRLLLNSNKVRGGGIGNDHGTVGRYLSTHPKANMGALILSKPVSTHQPLFTDKSLDGGLLRYGLGLSEAAQKTNRTLNHYVQLLPFLEYQANNLFERVKGSALVESPLIDRTPLVRGIVPGIGLIAFEAIGRLGRFQRRARKFILRGFLDQHPNPDNRVTLSAVRDPHGVSKANVKWIWTREDRASVIKFFELLDEDVRSRGLGSIEYGRLRSREEWPLIGIHSHFLGTTRMGNDPRTSVTTANCRVHGSDNLFVMGPSLFPVYGYANPVYTIGALSLRLADYLKEKLV